MPKVRRIFWVWGPPKSGKTTFTRYLEQEYAGGIVNMGECIEMARALQAYRGHLGLPQKLRLGPVVQPCGDCSGNLFRIRELASVHHVWR